MDRFTAEHAELAENSQVFFSARSAVSAVTVLPVLLTLMSSGKHEAVADLCFGGADYVI